MESLDLSLTDDASPSVSKHKRAGKKGLTHPAERVGVAAAQKTSKPRWALLNGIGYNIPTAPPDAPTQEPRKRRKMSRATRTKMAAAQKARWEKVRAENAAA